MEPKSRCAATIEDLLKAITAELSPSEIIAATNKAAIGYQIFSYRDKYSMSIEELAKRLLVSKSTARKMESGFYNFSIDDIAKIAEKLDMQFSIILKPNYNCR